MGPEQRALFPRSPLHLALRFLIDLFFSKELIEERLFISSSACFW